MIVKVVFYYDEWMKKLMCVFIIIWFFLKSIFIFFYHLKKISYPDLARKIAIYLIVNYRNVKRKRKRRKKKRKKQPTIVNQVKMVVVAVVVLVVLAKMEKIH